ncbi:MAG TPA: cytochrome P450 [Pilimelia sp.]|nr:cytochrome P450 [Pilimelia sp.]
MEAASLKQLLSPEGRRDPFAYYAALHQRGPAVRLDGSEGYDLLVHGYDAVNQALRDPVLQMQDAPYLDRTSPRWRRHTALVRLKDSIFFTNGDDHTRVRRLFGQVFTARRVTALEPAIAAMTTPLLDHIAELGAGGTPVNFMSEFAFPLPSNVVGELLGVPERDRAWFRPRVLAIGAILELDGINWTTMTAANAAAGELTDYFVELAARRRVEPRDDLISALLQVQAAGGGQLSDAELLGNMITVFNAGFVTTTHMFGHGLALLLRHPDLLARLRADPDFTLPYLEEVLRFESPAPFGMRWATADTEAGGLAIPRGSTVLLALGAANRDPRAYPEPDVFNPTRDGPPPLHFGAGPHYCLGAALTRAEGRVALPMLVDRFPKLALAGALAEPAQLTFRGYEHLPITVD